MSRGCGSRLCDYFFAPSHGKPAVSDMSTEEAHLLLKRNQIGIMFYVICLMALNILWGLGGIIPGFTLFDGAAGYSAYCRLGWWHEIEWVVIVIVLVTTYFGLEYSMVSGTIEKGVENVVLWCGLAFFAMVLGIVANIIQAGFTIAETATCSSTLCMQNQWALICLIVFLFALAVLKIILCYRVVVYKLHLKYAIEMGRIDMNLTGGKDVEQQTPIPTQSRITPLLKKHAEQRLKLK